tara:strand:- start:2366 stop:2842 length:477 start_codon:yes stop_codon:yes gene_type:complete
MKIIKKIIFTIILLTLTNCGFKVLDKSQFKKFKITEVNNFGDNKVNFLVKNQILNNFNLNGSNERLRINLQTNKTKTIKEKNKKNQITKYNINLSTTVLLEFLDQNMKKEFIIDKTGYYDVKENHRTTLNNIRNLENNLAVQISDEIKNKLISFINDL